ncbi:MAG: tRNA-dihydrouridine synthase [Anaerolineae bacterium]|nr:tRNA-dihydrouridine synthase [Anaerolineae bacterium]
MIELAPKHKFGLPIQNPVMPAAGCFGYGEEYRELVDIGALGAIVTNPVSVSPRRAARGQRVAVYGDQFIVHTGHPNPGIRQVIRQYRSAWERSPVPVIVHLLAGSPAQTGRAARLLSGIPGVIGIELGLAEGTSRNKARALVESVQIEGDLPVIVRVPFGHIELARYLAAAGADALTLTAPPRAVLPLEEETLDDQGTVAARYMRGRLYGPAQFPLLMHQLTQWVRKLPVPVIACGGIRTPQEAQACLYLGAAAVQIDALLWRDPTLLTRIAQSVKQVEFEQEQEEEMSDDLF